MRVIFAYKNFAAHKNISHIGLGVAALNTSKVLIRNGVTCDVWPIVDSNHLRKLLHLDHSAETKPAITHVIISAPWIPTESLNHLCRLFPRIHFAVNCHSNVGFLQADPNGMKLLREGLGLEMQLPNFSVAANSEKMKNWVVDAYGNPCQYLPNLYFLDGVTKNHRRQHHHSKLKIGLFGASRPQKNIVSAAGAAVEISYLLKADAELWISSGRTEGAGHTILNTVKEMVQGLPNITLKEAGWKGWPEFRRLVGSMHLLLQPSYTESFNMVTADGIAEGVPSVVGEAIDWVPKNWQANVDDVMEIAHVGLRLLMDPRAVHYGEQHLNTYIEKGVQAWLKYLNGSRKHFPIEF